jgi:hypothetical protein
MKGKNMLSNAQIGTTHRFCAKEYCRKQTKITAHYTDEGGFFRARPVCEKHKDMFNDEADIVTFKLNRAEPVE